MWNYLEANKFPQMAEGCAGDGFDLFQLVSWSDGVMNRLVDGHSTISLLSDQEKRVVVQAVVALADAFEVAEKEHRHHYGMDLILTEREEVPDTHSHSVCHRES
jgi:hypothetical protein